MPPINKLTIGKKLSKLQQSIFILKELKKTSRKNFVEQPDKNGSAMYYLIIGIEAITDIGNHLLKEAFNHSADSCKDIILGLGNTKIVPAKFAKNNLKMADFRNRLIHIYDDISLNEVYDHLQKAPAVFQKFAKYFADFLEK